MSKESLNEFVVDMEHLATSLVSSSNYHNKIKHKYVCADTYNPNAVFMYILPHMTIEI